MRTLLLDQGDKNHNCRRDQHAVEPPHAAYPSIPRSNVLLLRANWRKVVVRLARAIWKISEGGMDCGKIGWVVSTRLLTPTSKRFTTQAHGSPGPRRGFLFAPVVDRIAGGRSVAERRSTLARGSYFRRKISVSFYATEERMIETPHALAVLVVLCGAVVILALVDRIKERRQRR